LAGIGVGLDAAVVIAAVGGGSSPALAAGAIVCSELRVVPQPNAISAKQLLPNILTLRTDKLRLRVLFVMAEGKLRL
jgi:hypothetical protein